MTKEDKKRVREGEGKEVLSVISGRCPGTAWHKQQRQQDPIFSNSHLSEGTIHHTSG